MSESSSAKQNSSGQSNLSEGSSSLSHLVSQPSLEIEVRVDTLCDCFEAAWEQGKQPQIEHVLGAIPIVYQAGFFRALLLCEINVLVNLGRRVDWAGYERRFPQFSSTVQDLAGAFASQQSSLEPRTVRVSESPARAADNPPTSPRFLQPGTRIGDYQLLDEIARGGLAVVFKARQISLPRVVALKLVHARTSTTKEDVQRFRNEPEVAARLQHPNIVPVFETGRHDDTHYFSMPFLKGGSLAKKAAEGPLDPREAAQLVATISRAAHYAHLNNVIHRDLKPGNVLLDQDGQPMITDFGLAKYSEQDHRLTTTGAILGTTSYMPPEQARGDIQAISSRSDIYSLGAILYHLTTGRPPFQSSSQMETARQVLEAQPFAPRQLNAAIDRDLETITLNCLEKNPRQRYASAEELADDLQRFLGNQSIRARPVNAAGLPS